ncbi:MAG: hypothetical protein HQM14_17515 [SAR324 cluster bacterium]|nr:hypothetical protein [SAR324 cluster bacterium]
MLPLEKLVRRVFDEKKSLKHEFITSLGYKNINNAYTRLYHCLRTGEEFQGIIKRLPSVLNIDQVKFNQALAKTRLLADQEKEKKEIKRLEKEKRTIKEKECRERKPFSPYLYIQSSQSRPTPIVPVAMFGIAAFKHVALPTDICEYSLAEQREVIRKIILMHFKEHQGKCPCFGKIIRYIFRKTCAAGIEYEFSISGELIDVSLIPVAEGRVSLQLDHQILSRWAATQKVFSRSGTKCEN